MAAPNSDGAIESSSTYFFRTEQTLNCMPEDVSWRSTSGTCSSSQSLLARACIQICSMPKRQHGCFIHLKSTCWDVYRSFGCYCYQSLWCHLEWRQGLVSMFLQLSCGNFLSSRWIWSTLHGARKMIITGMTSPVSISWAKPDQIYNYRFIDVLNWPLQNLAKLACQYPLIGPAKLQLLWYRRPSPRSWDTCNRNLGNRIYIASIALWLYLWHDWLPPAVDNHKPRMSTASYDGPMMNIIQRLLHNVFGRIPFCTISNIWTAGERCHVQTTGPMKAGFIWTTCRTAMVRNCWRIWLDWLLASDGHSEWVFEWLCRTGSFDLFQGHVTS